MYQSNTYNYEWFVDWLRRNLFAPQKTDYNTTASHISRNFSRLYFNVSETDAIQALKTLGFEYQEQGSTFIFSLDRSSPAFVEFRKTYD